VSAFIGKGNLKPEVAELRRLQKELEEVKEEREILRKLEACFPQFIKINAKGNTTICHECQETDR